MFKTVKRIIDWCGEFKGKLYLGFIFSFFSYWFAAMPVMVAAYTIGMLLDAGRGAGTFDRAWIWKSLVIMGVFVFLRKGQTGGRRCPKTRVARLFCADEYGKYFKFHHNGAGNVREHGNPHD